MNWKAQESSHSGTVGFRGSWHQHGVGSESLDRARSLPVLACPQAGCPHNSSNHGTAFNPEIAVLHDPEEESMPVPTGDGDSLCLGTCPTPWRVWWRKGWSQGTPNHVDPQMDQGWNERDDGNQHTWSWNRCTIVTLSLEFLPFVILIISRIGHKWSNYEDLGNF